jgi:hypothetical protein
MQGPVMRRVINVLLLGGAIFGLFFGYTEYKLSGSVKAEPQTIRCADLIQKGPGDNGHVIVTDFAFEDDYVIEGESANDSTWKKAYVPMFPAPQGDAQAPPHTGSFKLILETARANNEQKLNALEKQDRIQGSIVTSIKSLDSETQNILRSKYPQTDFNSVMILEHERKPVSTLVWVGAFVVGGLCAVLLIVGIIWSRRVV